MPPRKKAKKSKRQHGKGFLGDAAKFIKDNHLISKGLGMIPYAPAQMAGQVAGMAGLGRKSHAISMHGRGIFGDIGSGIGSIAHGFFGMGRPVPQRGVLTMVVGRPVVSL
jgi:hypothetical protein